MWTFFLVLLWIGGIFAYWISGMAFLSVAYEQFRRRAHMDEMEALDSHDNVHVVTIGCCAWFWPLFFVVAIIVFGAMSVSGVARYTIRKTVEHR